MKLSAVKFDCMAPMPDSDEHVAGFYVTDGWDIVETAPGMLTVTGHGKSYVWRNYPYAATPAPAVDAVPAQAETGDPSAADLVAVADRPTTPALEAKRQRKARA